MPLYGGIAPLAVYYQTENSENSPSRFRYICVKLAPHYPRGAIDYIQRVYNSYSPGYPFEFHFLSDDYVQLYGGVRRMGIIISYFSFIAVLISCMGLFGLASYMAVQRTKEICVRKVLGSSVIKIVLLFLREFAKLILIASIIARPVSKLMTTVWLTDFAYRTRVGVGVFLLATLVILFFAMATVAFQSIKAARANPVDSLKYE